MPVPPVVQLTLNDEQRQRLEALIRDDYTKDSYDLERRTNALDRWYKLWRNAMEPAGFPEQEKSNFSIPLVMWQILAKLSKELDALLGEESEIVVNPVGESDTRRVEKVRKWMNWRIKVSLKLFKKLYVYLLQKYIFGTTLGFVSWKTKMRTVKEPVNVPDIAMQPGIDPGTGLPTMQQVQVGSHMEIQEKQVLDFDGPDLEVESLEDIFFPAQARSYPDDCDHYIRRLRLSVEQILDMRDEGKLDATVINPNLEQLKTFARTIKQTQNEPLPNTQITREKREQQGLPTAQMGREEHLVILNWFGKFRLNEQDERPLDVVAFFSRELNKLVGCARLIDVFPDGRWPNIKSDAVLDVNTLWGIGFAEMLEPVNREMDAFHRLATDAGEGAIGPVIFYEPSTGFNPEKTRIEPYTAIPTANAKGVQVVNLGQINLSPYVILMQQLMGFAERMTALTDAQMGRQFDRPNAPRTYGQQALLQAESNVRLLLDIRLERENLAELLDRIWEMDKKWLPKPFFFRVTEEDPGDVLTDEDMMGDFDFYIGPVTSISNRAARMQDLMQAIALTQPIPQAYMPLVKKAIEKLGYPDIAAGIPDPSLNVAQTPDVENARMWQGEDVDPHPMDNHLDHIAKHQDFLQRMQQEYPVGMDAKGKPVTSSPVQSNPGLAGRVQSHIAEHEAALKQGAGAATSMMMGKHPMTSNVTPGAGTGQAMPAIAGALSQLNPQAPGSPAGAQNAAMMNQGNLNIA